MSLSRQHVNLHFAANKHTLFEAYQKQHVLRAAYLVEEHSCRAGFNVFSTSCSFATARSSLVYI